MKHYGISQWVDYARGLAAEAESRAMRVHLAEGCDECRDLATFCERLRDVCQDLSAYPVPENVVRNAKAIFPASMMAEPRGARLIPARLVYDSLLAPEPAGLRASWQTGWQALYTAGDCSLDLRVEPELASLRAAVIGQVSNHVTPAITVGDAQIFLKSGRSVVAETRSNRFGEFQMEYEQHDRLQLCVYLDNASKRFQVPLKKLASERVSTVERLAPISRPVKPKSGGNG